MRAGARTSSSNTTSSSNRRDWNRSWSGGPRLRRFDVLPSEPPAQESELAGREPLLADPDLEAALERRSTAQQLDQGVERAHLGSVSLVVCAQSNPPDLAGIIQLGIS